MFLVFVFWGSLERGFLTHSNWIALVLIRVVSKGVFLPLRIMAIAFMVFCLFWGGSIEGGQSTPSKDGIAFMVLILFQLLDKFCEF